MSIKNLAPHVVRTLLGTAFLVFGLNGFLHFLPMPAAPDGAMKFMGALAATGYMFPFLKGTEVLVGALLLSNLFVPLALVVLAPVMLNIIAFHLFLEAPQTVGLPLMLLSAQLYLAWTQRAVYAPLLSARLSPAPPEKQVVAGGALIQAS